MPVEKQGVFIFQRDHFPDYAEILQFLPGIECGFCLWNNQNV
ncbi:MAG: hypothetical protein ABR886_05540 [Dehalococcoidales bacterium]